MSVGEGMEVGVKHFRQCTSNHKPADIVHLSAKAVPHDVNLIPCVTLKSLNLVSDVYERSLFLGHLFASNVGRNLKIIQRSLENNRKPPEQQRNDAVQITLYTQSTGKIISGYRINRSNGATGRKRKRKSSSYIFHVSSQSQSRRCSRVFFNF